MITELKTAFFADKPVSDLYTPEFKLLTIFADLLKRARAQVKHEAGLRRRSWQGSVVKKALPVPMSSEAHKHLWAGSDCSLWVPEYKSKKKE